MQVHEDKANKNSINIWLYSLLFISAVSVLSYLAGRSPTTLTFAFVFIILLVPIFEYKGLIPPFEAKIFTPLKILSLSITVLIPGMLIINILPLEWLRFTFFLLWIVNIGEAVLMDLKFKNIFNAISGILLIAVLIRIDNIKWVASEGMFLIGSSAIIYWVIAYLLWNLCFVYTTFKPAVAFHLFLTYITVSVLFLVLAVIVFVFGILHDQFLGVNRNEF